MPGEPIQRRPMADLEKARVLALARCHLGIIGWANRVLPELLRRVRQQEVPQISEREAQGLAGVAWKHRGQLKKRGAADLVPESEPAFPTSVKKAPDAPRQPRPTAKQRERAAKLERAMRGEW